MANTAGKGIDVRRVSPDEFKSVNVKSGSKARFLVRVGELISGSELSIPVVVVRGNHDGPCVYIAAGTHPEETCSIEAVTQFGAQVQPEEVFGTLIVVPVQNPPAWAFRSRVYPLDAPTAIDLAGHRSGDPKGILTQRVLAALADSITLNANYALDIHSTHLDSINYPFTTMLVVAEETPEEQKNRLKTCRDIGNQLIRVIPERPGGIQRILNHRGCPAHSFEAGEGWRALEPFISIILRGIRNFCKSVGVTKGEIERPQMIVEYTRLHEITADRGGMSNLFVKPGQYVRSGEVVAVVRDMFDSVVDELRTPANGIVGRCTLLPAVATGARVCNVAETDRGEEWERRIEPELERQIRFSGTPRPRG